MSITVIPGEKSLILWRFSLSLSGEILSIFAILCGHIRYGKELFEIFVVVGVDCIVQCCWDALAAGMTIDGHTMRRVDLLSDLRCPSNCRS